MRSINNRIENKTLMPPQTKRQPIQEKRAKLNGVTYSSQPKLGVTSKRCIDIADKITKNPISKLSGKDLTLMRAHKRELKGKVRTLQKRDNLTTKKILKLGKHILQIKPKGPSKLEIAQAEYQAVSKVYKNVIDFNPSAKQAKAVQTLLKNANSELSKAGNEWQNVDCEFQRAFEEQAEFLKPFGSITALLEPKTDENLQQREVFLERLVSGSEQVRCSEALKKKPISWLHGTRSPALAVMMATDKTMHPTGQLLEHNVIPLTGELGIGITGSGVNRENISGTSISRLGAETTVSYASDFKASAAEEWNKVSPTHIDKIIGWTESTLRDDPKLEDRFAEGTKFDWLQVGLYVERLKVMDPDYSEKISELKSHLDKLILDKQEKPGQEKTLEFLKDLRGKCDTPPFITPTQSIRSSVTDSFPIVLAASNVTGTLVYKPLDEYAVKGSVSLEKISVAFTTSENVDRLQKMVTEAGLDIEVMDFNALNAIAVNAPETGESNRGESGS